jgi:VWFA-related protein
MKKPLGGAARDVWGRCIEVCILCVGLGLIFFLPSRLSSQSSTQPASSAQANTPPQESSGEMAIHDESATPKVAEAARFRVNVKLVLARVVVRDASGHVIGNLHKEDFQISDNGKPQVISDFDVEHLATQPSAPAAATSSSAANAVQPAAPPTLPSRYIAYLFDDVHLNFADLALVRQAAKHRVEALAATERAAIFTTSGQTTLDFTDDHAKLRQTLEKLLPRPTAETQGPTECPLVTFYQADLIVNKHDQQALQTGINDYINCAGLPQQMWSSVGPFVEGKADQVLNVGEHESRLAIGVLRDVVRRMAAMPGQRTLVLISPGFLTPAMDMDYDNNDVIDRALRSQVVISTLDARGLYVDIPGGDASNPGRPDIPPPGQINSETPRTLLDSLSAAAQDDILSVLASSTGGSFFHNNNDMEAGFRRVADNPEFYYVLGFTPQNLKMDGRYHTLKVTLKTREKYDLQARRGYFAPQHDVDAAEEAKREIEDEVLSSEELHDLPVVLHTQFFKASDDSAKLTVLARVDVKRLHYKQADNRNQNDLTVVTAVFDHNGNFLQANQKVIQMRWRNETLQEKLGSGITLRTSFDVKPGRYLVRVVARDTEQQLMSAENGAVEIP